MSLRIISQGVGHLLVQVSSHPMLHLVMCVLSWRTGLGGYVRCESGVIFPGRAEEEEEGEPPGQTDLFFSL